MKTTVFLQLNYFTVLFAAISYFVLGSLWYSPKVFAKKMLQLNYIRPEGRKDPTKVALVAFLSSITCALVIDYFICLSNASTAIAGMSIGILSALGVMSTTVGVSFLFEDRKVKLYMNDAGFHLTGFMVMGIILSMWR
ncbi:MAG: DUF1761 domain-containing protein [Bacteroidota bacterium]|nr:DUF1761 domain-containing protein [Bacteroidota bacterium]MDP4190720.1 DUF1761 domain-containing protein [Bacteroidota bacterium]MDP4196485.1 DUF1761 domain-containing protein [Bacteroidota bacterium]